MNEGHRPPGAPLGQQPAHPASTLHAQPHVQPARNGLHPAPQSIRSTVPPTFVPDGSETDPIELVADEAEQTQSKKIRAFGVAEGHASKADFKRKPHLPGTGAMRVRSFHGKLSEQGLGYMDDAINVWLDAHPDIEVKFVTSTVGQFEGKLREPALILNVWY